MRIGIYGGTFDPVHLGHLILAEQCREQALLEEVWFIPAYVPPHKQDQKISSFSQRVEMLQLAIAGNTAFQINELERAREGPSYTVDTLSILCEMHPRHELCLIMGSDCLPDLAKWHNPARIFALAEVIVVARPGFELWSKEKIAASVGMRHDPKLRLQFIDLPEVDLASRDLRTRIESGRTVRYLLPRAVECYIEAHGLYRVH